VVCRCWICTNRDWMNGTDWRIVPGPRGQTASSGKAGAEAVCDMIGIRVLGLWINAGNMRANGSQWTWAMGAGSESGVPVSQGTVISMVAGMLHGAMYAGMDARGYSSTR